MQLMKLLDATRQQHEAVADLQGQQRRQQQEQLETVSLTIVAS